MTKACESVRDLLVDFADDELDEATAISVDDHLQNCSACRSELTDLRRSLALAQDIWHDSIRTATNARSIRSGQSIKRPLAIAAAVSAVVAGAWLAGNSWLRENRDSTQPQVAQAGPQAAVEATDLNISDIAELISQETQSARLAASRQLLAERPSLTDYSRHADNYLATTYQHSSAGVEAKQRLEMPASSDTGSLP